MDMVQTVPRDHEKCQTHKLDHAMSFRVEHIRENMCLLIPSFELVPLTLAPTPVLPLTSLVLQVTLPTPLVIPTPPPSYMVSRPPP